MHISLYLGLLDIILDLAYYRCICLCHIYAKSAWNKDSQCLQSFADLLMRYLGTSHFSFKVMCMSVSGYLLCL